MLEVKNLTKYYGAGKNKIIGCKNISFKLEKGGIVSLLGLNGAGKSSIINCITGYLFPDEGNIFIDGISILEDEIKAKKKIGVLYEQNPLYVAMSVFDFLFFSAQMRGADEIYSLKKDLKTDSLNSIVNEVIEFCELEDYSQRLISNLSKGYKQRVGLAQAIINNPDLLILDEPSSGLDIPQVHLLEKKLFEISKEKTVLLSTHNLRQASKICSKHILVNNGEIIAQGAIYQIREQLEQEGCEFENNNPETVLEQAFIFFAGVNKNEFNKIRAN